MFLIKVKGIVLIFSLFLLTYSRMTDCLAYSQVLHGAKQMGTVQAEAALGKDVLDNFVFVKRNNWMGFFFLYFCYLDSALERKKIILNLLLSLLLIYILLNENTFSIISVLQKNQLSVNAENNELYLNTLLFYFRNRKLLILLQP